jgi:hypothetical protein
LIHSSGSNQDGEEDPDRARNVFGFRSYAHILCDDALHVSWVVYTSVHAANSDERVIFPSDFRYFQQRLPQIPIAEVVADAALGFADCLDTIYQARAIPVTAMRRDPNDKADLPMTRL